MATRSGWRGTSRCPDTHCNADPHWMPPVVSVARCYAAASGAVRRSLNRWSGRQNASSRAGTGSIRTGVWRNKLRRQQHRRLLQRRLGLRDDDGHDGDGRGRDRQRLQLHVPGHQNHQLHLPDRQRPSTPRPGRAKASDESQHARNPMTAAASEITLRRYMISSFPRLNIIDLVRAFSCHAARVDMRVARVSGWAKGRVASKRYPLG